MKQIFVWGLYRTQFDELYPKAFRTRREVIEWAERNLTGEKWRTLREKYGFRAVRCLLSCKGCKKAE